MCQYFHLQASFGRFSHYAREVHFGVSYFSPSEHSHVGLLITNQCVCMHACMCVHANVFEAHVAFKDFLFVCVSVCMRV